MAEADEAEARARGASQDVDERKLYANRLFGLVVAWLTLDTVVLVAVGMNSLLGHQFFLSDAVVIAVLTTSTATVVGLLVIVTKYLFGRSVVPSGVRG